MVSVSGVKDGAVQDYTGCEFFSSMPIKDLIAGMSDAPEDVAAIAHGLPYHDFVTVGLLVDRLNLKNETKIATLGNIVPDCWIYVQDVGVKLGRIQIFNNWSPYMLQDPEHSLWIGLEYFCREGDESWSMPEEEWKKRGANIIIYANQLMRAEVPAMQKAAELILRNHRAEECDSMLMPFKDIIRLIPAED